MDIDVFRHGRFFGGVFGGGNVASDSEGAAVPGVKGQFGTGESVGGVDDDFGAKDFGGAGQQLDERELE